MHPANRCRTATSNPATLQAFVEKLVTLLFLDLYEARQIVTAWVADYNTGRLHSSLGYTTPGAYADHLTATPRRWAYRQPRL
jgi:transposase InsO family protein